MAKKSIGPSSPDISDYRHDDAKRTNNPPAGIAGRGAVEKKAKQVYAYDPHLPPILRFDQQGKPDALPALLQEARKRPLTEDEAQLLAEALRNQEPWLEWTGKREKKRVEVDPVALHIHERVSARAILQVAAKQTPQRTLFADPVQSYKEAVQFYQHDVGWANRLILGDSLAVMSSLAVRENLASKVQMIYLDPPYGIKYMSNFQPAVGQRDIKDRDSDLTRETEVVRAYRDTWSLGVHTYLGYLRERLRVARDLLADTGSIFVQISDDHIHRVRAVLDEVFGSQNFQSQITIRKTGGLGSSGLTPICDFVLWYAKSASQVKFRKLFVPKDQSGTEDQYNILVTQEGEVRGWQGEAGSGRRAQATAVHTMYAGVESCLYDCEFDGRKFSVPRNRQWSTTLDGMTRIHKSERLRTTGSSPRLLRYLDDYPVGELTSLWADLMGTRDKVYTVQTSTRIVERCMLMTTDPGDLVLDPTCGSGTTAHVAEQWGRRWITVDSSRVALFIARQRILTATFDYFKLRNSARGVNAGFVNKTVPHITLKSIAQNKALDPIFARHAGPLENALLALNKQLVAVSQATRDLLADKLKAKRKAKNADDPVTEADDRRSLLPKIAWQEWEVPFDTDPDWPKPLQDALVAYRTVWRAKMDDVNGCIDRNADQEELVDQPEVDRKVLRVSGPFTVEGVEPMENSLDEPTPIAEPEGTLPTMIGDRGGGYHVEAANTQAYVEKMLRLLRSDGVRFMGNKQVKIERLDRRSGSVLTGEGDWQVGEGSVRTLAVVVGPQYGPVTAKAVEQAIRAAARGGFDDLLVAGFAFDSEATAVIDADSDTEIRCHLAHIRPDVQMEDLLKDSPNSQIFTVFGSPRSRVEDVGGAEFVAHMEGMDVYDPVANALLPTGADKVAAWFLDTDYDGRTFCIAQAFFPDRTAWDKLARALKGTLEEGAFEKYSGKKSLPFVAGKERRVAVKVIDPRGNEVMRVHELPEAK